MKTAYDIYGRPKIKRGICCVGKCKEKLYSKTVCKTHWDKHYLGKVPKIHQQPKEPWWFQVDWKKTNKEIAEEFSKTRNYISVLRRKKGKLKATFACKLTKL